MGGRGGIPDMFKGSFLMEEAFFGDAQNVNDLIQKGADVNESNSYGITALILAALKGRVDCVHLLIQAGADVNKVSNAERWSAISCAARNDFDKCVEELIKAKADLNTVDSEGFSALSRAASYGYCTNFYVYHVPPDRFFSNEANWQLPRYNRQINCEQRQNFPWGLIRDSFLYKVQNICTNKKL